MHGIENVEAVVGKTFTLRQWKGLTFRLHNQSFHDLPDAIKARMVVVQVYRDNLWQDFVTIREDDLPHFDATPIK